jgi:hypothetical protein
MKQYPRFWIFQVKLGLLIDQKRNFERKITQKARNPSIGPIFFPSLKDRGEYETGTSTTKTPVRASAAAI